MAQSSIHSVGAGAPQSSGFPRQTSTKSAVSNPAGSAFERDARGQKAHAAGRGTGDDWVGHERATSREDFRQTSVEAIPKSYVPALHLLGTVGPALVAIVVAALALDAPVLWEWATIPILFVVANFIEWHLHKNLLHHRTRGVAVLYDQHTPIHHRLYRYGDMAMRSRREWKLVLMPAAAVGGAVVILAPLAALVGQLVSANAGWLVLLTVAGYMMGYELTHLAYHLPADHPVGRNRMIAKLREHHARHHDPRLMQRYNFNVTLPLGDWVFRTMAPAELARPVDPQKRSPRLK